MDAKASQTVTAKINIQNNQDNAIETKKELP